MRKLILGSCIAALCLGAVAAPKSFDFKDPKGVNNVVFELDAPLEAISGSASGISGKIDFDPQDPSSLKGKIVVAANSMHVGNPMMKEHMHGDKWMDVAKHPELTFEITGVKNHKTANNVTTADVTGKLTVKGTTKEVTVPATLTYLPDKLKARGGRQDGDLLVVRANFNIKRSDFGINAGQNEDKVSDQIQLRLSIAGASPK
jgi:polyisoprenoid-binding protein YceI